MAGYSLGEKPTKQPYSFEVKKEAIERHLAGETKMNLAREFCPVFSSVSQGLDVDMA